MVKHTRIGCGGPPSDVRPAPLSINLCNLGDHIRLTHLCTNGHALRAKRPT